MTEHRVVFSQVVYALGDFLKADTHFFSHDLLTLQIVRYEFVQRRIEQADVNRATVHSFQNALEVGLLIWEQLSQCLFATFYGVGKNHFAHCHNLLIFEEHVFCTSKTDTLSAEVASYLSIVWSVGVGANLELGVLVAEVHKSLEVTRKFSSLGWDFAGIYLTGRTVERDVVAFVVNHTFHFEGLGLVVDVESACTRNAALTHTASHNSCVRSHTAASSEDTFSSRHTCQVFRRCFDADHDNAMAVVVPCLSVVGVEYDLTTCSTRRCRKTLCDGFCLLQRVLVEYRVKEFVELLWFATKDSSLFVD